jgi:hypothetical protein
MKIAIIQNETITVGEYWNIFPNTSFGANGPSVEWLTQNNAMKVSVYKEYDFLTQKLTNCDPYVENNFVYLVSIVNLTTEEIEQQKDIAMDNLRQIRNRLLDESDKTQVADASMRFDQPAWAAYRQQLADFPATISDARLPYEFPTPPQ